MVKYKEDKFRRRDIIIVYRLVKKKLDKYAVLSKVIIYNSSIITI